MYRVMIPETENPQEAKSVYPGIGLSGMLSLIRVDTLRRVHNVDFRKATPLAA